MDTINVKTFKPKVTVTRNNKLMLWFSTKTFSVEKNDVEYKFVPVETQKIILNSETFEVENIYDTLVFKNRNHGFLDIEIYKLLAFSDIKTRISEITQDFKCNYAENEKSLKVRLKKETLSLVAEIEKQNLENLFDEALDKHDKGYFEKLMKMKEGWGLN